MKFKEKLLIIRNCKLKLKINIMLTRIVIIKRKNSIRSEISELAVRRRKKFNCIEYSRNVRVLIIDRNA